MEQTHVATGPAVSIWWKRENLVPGLALLLLTALTWAYTLSQAGTMAGMDRPAATESISGTPASTTMENMNGMDMPSTNDEHMPADEPAAVFAWPSGLLLFLFGWAVMMVAMMLPAALPLILLYCTIAHKRLPETTAVAGIAALLAGYLGVWIIAGALVYAYNLLSQAQGPVMKVAPGILLIAGGIYQFTALKHGCHNRCSNPLFFLMNKWQPGIVGALRLGALHGIDCLGCCVGLMLALVALGMMNVAWMLTAAVIIFVEKTLPGGHRIARPLGIVLALGGMMVLSASLSSAMAM